MRKYLSKSKMETLAAINIVLVPLVGMIHSVANKMYDDIFGKGIPDTTLWTSKCPINIFTNDEKPERYRYGGVGEVCKDIMITNSDVNIITAQLRTPASITLVSDYVRENGKPKYITIAYCTEKELSDILIPTIDIFPIDQGIYGSSIQLGTPTPESPKEIVNVLDDIVAPDYIVLLDVCPGLDMVIGQVKKQYWDEN